MDECWLTDGGALHIPEADQHDFVDRLLDIPSLPRLDLPKELQLEEIRTSRRQCCELLRRQ
jgi:hypothetical protein